MSLSFARAILDKVPLIPTTRTLRHKEIVNLECEGVAANVTIYYADVGAHLNFYIFDIQDFDLLIGYPIEKLFVDTSLSGTLDVKLGRDKYVLSLAQAKNSLADPLPTIETVMEVDGITPFESPESSLEQDSRFFINEHDELSETVNLPAQESPAPPQLS